MGYGELIEKLRALPQEQQAEVFDFVEFLASRFGEPAADGERTERAFSKFSFGDALRGTNDEPVIYRADDLSKRNGQKPSLVEFLRASPLAGIDLEIQRDRLPDRTIDLLAI